MALPPPVSFLLLPCLMAVGRAVEAVSNRLAVFPSLVANEVATGLVRLAARSGAVMTDDGVSRHRDRSNGRSRHQCGSDGRSRQRGGSNGQSRHRGRSVGQSRHQSRSDDRGGSDGWSLHREGSDGQSRHWGRSDCRSRHWSRSDGRSRHWWGSSRPTRGYRGSCLGKRHLLEEFLTSETLMVLRRRSRGLSEFF